MYGYLRKIDKRKLPHATRMRSSSQRMAKLWQMIDALEAFIMGKQKIMSQDEEEPP